MLSNPRLRFELTAVVCFFATAFLTIALQRHPTRRRVWLPAGFFSLFLATAVAWFQADLAVTGALVGGGLAAVGTSCRRYRGTDAALYLVVLVCLWTGAVLGVHRPSIELYGGTVCVIATMTAFWSYRRYVAETLLEWPLRIMYRIRAVGPGMKEIPRIGPVLVIANHVSYLEPCWVMIRIPRDLTPIMYGEYFNIPGIHFYMKRLIGAIPSGVGTFRRDAPELEEAVRRVDHGEGLLIFPEGQVRRKEEDDLRRFAQGVWRILRDRPTTPIVACWIEGGWGSWSSFQGGRPFQGKRIDIRRPIDIAVSAPVVLDPETLAVQHRTRELLRQMVLNARQHLGLQSR